MSAVLLEKALSRLAVDAGLGRAYWKNPPNHHPHLRGKLAGSVRTYSRQHRYCFIKIDGVPVKRAHIVFAVVHNRWPRLMIDHKNGNTLDDRAINLREATPLQNAWNAKRRKRGAVLPRGVRRMGRKFQARIRCRGELICLGCFSKVSQAKNSYAAARKELYGDFA